MPLVPRSVLKSFFETGDRPTQAQFSVASPTGDPTVDFPFDIMFVRGGMGTSSNFHVMHGNGEVLRPSFVLSGTLSEGSVIGPQGTFALSEPMQLSPGDRGYIGFSVTLDLSGAPATHYGYLDFSMDQPLAGETTNALTVYGWAYESIPQVPITAVPIPAPGAGVLLAAAAAMAWGRRKRVGCGGARAAVCSPSHS